MTPSTGSYPWLILHGKHDAWYQRALLRGDFAPGTEPLPNYVLALDGTRPDPSETPCCGTCGKVPKVEDLTPVERETKRQNFLDVFRNRHHPDWRPWSKAGRTKPDSCYVCNSLDEVLSISGYIKLCAHCEGHLQRGGE